MSRLYLPRPPLQSVSSVSYRDTTGSFVTWGSSNYAVRRSQATPGKDDHRLPGYLEPVAGVSYPSLYGQGEGEQVIITYLAGWLSRGSIPEAICQAMKVDLGDYDEHREDKLTGTIVANLGAVNRLTGNHRCVHDYTYGEGNSWRIRQVTPPTFTVLTLAEAKKHREFLEDDNNAAIDRLLNVVQEETENELSIALLTQTRSLILDRWPC